MINEMISANKIDFIQESHSDFGFDISFSLIHIIFLPVHFHHRGQIAKSKYRIFIQHRQEQTSRIDLSRRHEKKKQLSAASTILCLKTILSFHVADDRTILAEYFLPQYSLHP
jgi:hypothetical protein